MASWSRRPWRALTASTTRSSSAAESGSRHGLFGRETAPRPIERLLEAVGVDRLQDVVHRVHRKGIHGVLVEGGDEDELSRQVGFDEPPRDLEAGQSRHLHVQKDDVGPEIAGLAQRVEAVRRLADNLDTASLTQQKAQLLSRELLIVDHEGADGRHQAVARSWTTSSGISTRAVVPSPGALFSRSW